MTVVLMADGVVANTMSEDNSVLSWVLGSVVRIAISVVAVAVRVVADTMTVENSILLLAGKSV
jgi:hypothetical protein